MNQTEQREKQLILRHYYNVLHTLKEAYERIDVIIEETKQDVFKTAPQTILDLLEPVRNSLGKAIAREDL